MIDQPTLCPHCRTELLARLDAEPAPLDGEWCPHRRTLALVQCLRGEILRWYVLGPISKAQAAEVMHGVAGQIGDYLGNATAAAVVAAYGVN
jgi:hypothetical protein